MHVLNLKPQNSDERDYKLRLEQTMLSLPLRIDLRGECPPIFNQGELGSCTANAGVAARMMLGKIRTLLSRLYLYYKERELDGTINEDSGATMRTVCKALQRYGVCRELMWPYIIDNFAETPGKMAEENAKKYKITAYRTFDCDNTSDTIEQTKRYIAV
ncbi:MAG: hypothetical protein RR244_03140, partial [Oscillospiraceae bacterium]